MITLKPKYEEAIYFIKGLMRIGPKRYQSVQATYRNDGSFLLFAERDGRKVTYESACHYKFGAVSPFFEISDKSNMLFDDVSPVILIEYKNQKGKKIAILYNNNRDLILVKEWPRNDAVSLEPILTVGYGFTMVTNFEPRYKNSTWELKNFKNTFKLGSWLLNTKKHQTKALETLVDEVAKKTFG